MRALSCCVILVLQLPSLAALAAPTEVYFGFWGGGGVQSSAVERAIRDSFSKTPLFHVTLAAAQDTLIITVPDGVKSTPDGNTDVRTFTFDVVFFRHGRTLGRSFESCRSNKLADCTEQLMSDAISAVDTIP